MGSYGTQSFSLLLQEDKKCNTLQINKMKNKKQKTNKQTKTKPFIRPEFFTM